MEGISIIICCYNSAKRIEETIGCLLNQKTSGQFDWEIIVVDNASTDNTFDVITALCDSRQTGIPFRVVKEDIPGLINARMRGIRAATYDILIFCDDDNHLEPNYADKAVRLFAQRKEIAIAGGWNKPKFFHYPGKWIEANYGALAIDAYPRPEGYVKWVFGAGMVIRKKVFDELRSAGIEPMLIGRQGSRQTSGDDAELCHLIRFMGYKVYYTPELVLYHKISQSRLTRISFIKANFKNVFPVAYLFALNVLIDQPDISIDKVRYLMLKRVVSNVLYFFPRVFVGKHNFYSFIMYYQNVQLFLWAILRWSTLNYIHLKIKKNLYKL